ncbi:hypothetical protein BJY01DRAFT_203155 [Aspergillus pseudoustus]|uniref:Uncharacterized protein n=1 Tax=Aspergillus pseudoustus TaxID=1810923 RepID=A0ABR4KWG8_9EURO
MSHPILSPAVRRLSRPRSARAALSAFSFPAPTLSFSAPFCHSSYRTAIAQTTSKRSAAASPSTYSRFPRLSLTSVQPRSPFSSSTARPAAQVTQNPRTDDDGNTLMIGISERAANVGSMLHS